jgi:hypothetical protein
MLVGLADRRFRYVGPFIRLTLERGAAAREQNAREFDASVDEGLRNFSSR